MSKCGIIAKDIDTGKLKIKIYCDADGNFKGEARCGYVKVCVALCRA
jgi:HIV Tat-specific factor 1